MPLKDNGYWEPSQADIDRANVTALARRLGVSSYDEVYALSIQKPDVYWRAVLDQCGIRWSKDYDVFTDSSRGPEFTSWFAGGKLNWVDTIFAWGADPANRDRIALICENERSDVERVSFAELRERVRRLASGLRAAGLQKGDRVGLLMEPGAGAVVSVLALSFIGAVFLPLFSGFGVDPIVSRLTLCRAKALISTTGLNRRSKWIDRTGVATEAARIAGTELLILRTPDGSKPGPSMAID